MKSVKSIINRLSSGISKYGMRVIIAVVSFVLGLVIGCGGATKPRQQSLMQDMGIAETIDSFVAVMPEGASVIARFNDERHALYYLKSGHLMRFNAQSKMLEEVSPETSNANLPIYYDENSDASGIIAAKLSRDEKFIYFTALVQRPSENGNEPVKTLTYKLNTETLNMTIYDGKALDPPVVKKDTTKTKKPKIQVEAAEKPAEKPAEAEVATPQPEAAAPQVEKPAAAEPSHTESHPAAESATKGKETVIVPAQE